MVKWLKFIFAASLIFWLFHQGHINIEDIKAALNPQTAFLCVVLMLTFAGLTTFRWQLFLRTQGLDPGFFQLAKLFLIGLFFNFVIPSSVGGDVVKGYYLVRSQPQKRMLAACSILVDRVIGLYSLLLLSLISVALNYSVIMESAALKSLALVILLAFSGASVIVFLGLSDYVRNHPVVNRLFDKLPGGQFARNVYQSFNAYRSSLKTIGAGIGLSLIGHTLAVTVIYLAGTAMGESRIGFETYLLCVPLALAVTAIPIAPGGIGVGQVAVMTVFTMATGFESTAGQTGVTVFQFITFAISLPGLYFYLRSDIKSPGDTRDIETVIG